MRLLIGSLGAAIVAIALAPAPCRADVTAFLGVNTEPTNRPVVGVAAGAGLLLVVGFEIEFMSAREDLEAGAPSLRTGMGNVYAQNPIPINGLQFYATVGAGVYREAFADAGSTFNVGTNVGGGVKITLKTPLKLRLDYRVFSLLGSAQYTNPQRVYAGLTLAF
jgi:hypothetical protein